MVDLRPNNLLMMLRYSPRTQQNLATSLVELLPLKLDGAARVMADVVVEESLLVGETSRLLQNF